MSLLKHETDISQLGEEQPHNEWWSNIKSFMWETIKVVVISLVIIIPVRYFLIQPFYVQGASMEPTFHDNEYLIIDELSYRFNSPERGDVVVFRYIRDRGQFFIKRIIGLPGEEIDVHNGRLTVYNSGYPLGIVLNEGEYLSDDIITGGNTRIKLDIDEYYVLGDNRGSSLDSRNFGPISSDDIIGKVWFRGWPVERIGVIDKTIYEF